MRRARFHCWPSPMSLTIAYLFCFWFKHFDWERDFRSKWFTHVTSCCCWSSVFFSVSLTLLTGSLSTNTASVYCQQVRQKRPLMSAMNILVVALASEHMAWHSAVRCSTRTTWCIELVWLRGGPRHASRCRCAMDLPHRALWSSFFGSPICSLWIEEVGRRRKERETREEKREKQEKKERRSKKTGKNKELKEENYRWKNQTGKKRKKQVAGERGKMKMKMKKTKKKVRRKKKKEEKRKRKRKKNEERRKKKKEKKETVCSTRKQTIGKKKKMKNVKAKSPSNGRPLNFVTEAQKIKFRKKIVIFTRNFSTIFFGFSVCSDDWKKGKRERHTGEGWKDNKRTNEGWWKRWTGKNEGVERWEGEKMGRLVREKNWKIEKCTNNKKRTIEWKAREFEKIEKWKNEKGDNKEKKQLSKRFKNGNSQNKNREQKKKEKWENMKRKKKMRNLWRFASFWLHTQNHWSWWCRQLHLQLWTSMSLLRQPHSLQVSVRSMMASLQWSTSPSRSVAPTGLCYHVAGLGAHGVAWQAQATPRVDVAEVPEKKDTNKHGKMLNIILKLERGEERDRSGKGWKVEGEKRRVTQERVQEAEGGFRSRKFLGTTGLWNMAKKRNVRR